MSEHDIVGDAVERLEWDEKKSDAPVSKIAQITRRTALTGGAAGLAAVLLEACGSSNSSGTTTANAASSSSAASIFGVKGGYKFTLVNHVTTNTFFTPTQSGASDACKLLGCSYQWTGSETSSVPQMVSAINTAVSAGVDGIATSLIAAGSFTKPIAAATKAGIPVVSYNADEPGTDRLAYIGQDLLLSGQQMGQKIKTLLPGGGDIAVFIATPGSANLAPRLTGIQQVLKGSNIKVDAVASGAAEAQENTTIAAFISSHPTYKGFFAVDAGSTSAVAQAMQKDGLQKKGIVGGGFDLTPITEELLHDGVIEFAIDQQPYLQGFFPIIELFLYKASQGLTGAADVDTGLKFLDKSTVTPYSSTKSLYEGTGTKPGVQKA